VQARAIQRYIRIAPRKVRMVADLIRNKPVELALSTLLVTKKRGAGIIRKVLRSAIANAEANPEITNIDNLYVETILIDGGPTLKRFSTAPMGRAVRIRKRTTHITLVVAEQVKAQSKAMAKMLPQVKVPQKGEVLGTES